MIIDLGTEIENNKLSSISIYTKEEFTEKIQPLIYQQYKRLFDPTEEEKEKLKELVKDIEESDYSWTIDHISLIRPTTTSSESINKLDKIVTQFRNKNNINILWEK